MAVTIVNAIRKLQHYQIVMEKNGLGLAVLVFVRAIRMRPRPNKQDQD